MTLIFDTMGVISADFLIKTAIEAGLADLRANPWLLKDVFSELADDRISQTDYGHKEVDRAIDWFISNEIPVYLQHRIDQPTFPSIVIVDTGSREMTNERTSIGDDGHTEDFDVTQIEPTPQVMYPKFTPKSYDPSTGIVTFPDGTTTNIMVVGQILVSQRTGNQYPILKVLGPNTFSINKNTVDDFTDCYILPPTVLWNQQIENTRFSHNFTLFAASVSNSVHANWLWQALMYILLRYKEAYLEGRKFELSTFQSGPLTLDETFKPEMIYYRQVNLSGETTVSWIKYIAPKFQSVTAAFKILEGPATPPLVFEEQVEDQAWRMEDDPEFIGEPIVPGTGDIDVPVVPDGEFPADDEDGEND